MTNVVSYTALTKFDNWNVVWEEAGAHFVKLFSETFEALSS